MSEGNVPPSPYKGLIPYTEEDAQFFFGRDQKREIITANLIASRLTLLHGPSGVGKSSVLRAGVSYHLRKLAQQNLLAGRSPESAVIVFNSWRDDPVLGLATSVRETVAQLLNGQTLDPLPPSRELAQCLQTWTRQEPDGDLPNLDLLIILDQFEEYFLYHPSDEGAGTFAAELPRAINSSDLRANFLISIREDALAKLELFKGSIPHLFENRLSLGHLDQESAREAIVKPIDQYNLSASANGEPVRIEPALVNAILNQVKAGQVVFGPAGGTVEGPDLPSADTTIETPFLQLVMSRLWDEEMAVNSRVLRLDTLTRLGGAERIVRTHLDDTMGRLAPAEQEISSRIFYHLVTPSGSKIAHSVPDLAAFAGVAREELDPVLTKLADKAERILRPADPSPNRQSVQRYEIFHDVLAPAIVDWRTRFMQTLEQAESERQAEAHLKRAEQQAKIAKRLRWLTRALTAVCLAAIVVAGYAFGKRRQAEASQRQARAALDDKNRETEGRLHAEAAAAALQEKASIFKQEAAILRTDLEADDLVMQNAHQGALSKFSRLAQLYKEAQNGLSQAAQNGTDDEKELFKQYRLGEATTYFNMGQIHNDDGNDKEAISYYKKALDIRKEVLGGNDQDVAPILKAMADAYHDSHDDAKALASIKEAIRIYSTNPGFSRNKPPLKDAADTLDRIQSKTP